MPPIVAKRMRPIWRLPARQIFKKLAQFALGWIYMLVRPIIPYEASPGKPERSLAVVTGKCTQEQLALCQRIFDEGVTRRHHIEQKAQWTFTAIAFLIPTIASVLFFFVKDAGVQRVDHPLLLVVIVGSATLLVLSFVSALRAMAIKHNESLFVHSVIEEESDEFRSYEVEFHAKGLLHCAVMNAAVNDHTAQFVKGAYTLLAIAVVGFALGIGVIGFDVTGTKGSPGDLLNGKSSSVTQQDGSEVKAKGVQCRREGPDEIMDEFP